MTRQKRCCARVPKRPGQLFEARFHVCEGLLARPYEKRKSDQRCRQGGGPPGEGQLDAERVEQRENRPAPAEKEQKPKTHGDGREQHGQRNHGLYERFAPELAPREPKTKAKGGPESEGDRDQHPRGA